MGMTPDLSTLQKLYREDNPPLIGEIAEEFFDRDLDSSKTVEDYVASICEYAEALHTDQEKYWLISPFGGEDIDVESEEDIIINNIDRVHRTMSADGINITLLDFERLVYVEMLKRGWHSFENMNDFIVKYQTATNMNEILTDALIKLRKEETNYEIMIQDKIVYVLNTCKREIQEINAEIKELKSHKIRNFFFRRGYEKRLSELDKKNEMNENKMETARRDIEDSMEVRMARPKPSYIWGVDINSEAAADRVNKMADDFILNTDNQQKYQFYQDVIKYFNEVKNGNC